MAPKRRITTKGAPQALENVKRTRDGEPKAPETAIVLASQAMTPTPQQQPRHQQPQAGGAAAGGAAAGGGRGGGGGNEANANAGAIVPTKRGGGRGLKAVQRSKELEVEQAKGDGSTVQTKSKIKEQKLYHATSNEHVETRLMTEDKRRKTSKDGTVTISSCTTIKKVCYM